jgi:hypothetical protein
MVLSDFDNGFIQCACERFEFAKGRLFLFLVRAGIQATKPDRHLAYQLPLNGVEFEFVHIVRHLADSEMGLGHHNFSQQGAGMPLAHDRRYGDTLCR